MTTSVLALVQEFCGKKTLPVPGAVIGSTDTGVIQIRYLLAEALRELSQYHWQEQKIEKTWTSVATEDQGALTSVFGTDYRSLVPATMWDLTLKRPVFGPVTDASWGNLKAFPAAGPIYQYKILQNHLHIFPTPPAGHSMYVIYESNYPVTDSGGTAKATITADTDLFLVPDIIVSRSLDYRWKRQKGEPWEADYNEFMDLLPKQLNKDTMPVVHLDDARFKMTPGIWVPAGDWPH
jgi:hypothetical protein